MLNINDKNIVYCQGVKGAYSHIACQKIFKNNKIQFVKNFEDVCTNVFNSNDYGILPSENSNAGIVNGIIDLLVKYNLNIIYAKTIDISHMLCANKNTDIKNIKTIFSHQQALLQCSNFLSKLSAEQVETVNTAASAIMASKQDNTAAICSYEAAQIYGLRVLKDYICNSKTNSTRFIVISKEFYLDDNATTTSIYFKLKNKSGELYKILKLFADFGINLSSLHSLPLEEESWHYGFYIDCECNLNNDNFKNCLNAVKKESEYLKVLGCYLSE